MFTNALIPPSLLPSSLQCTPYVSAVEECIVPDLSHVVVDFLQSSPYLTSRQPELRQTSFWVKQLRWRANREARWREGEREGKQDERNTVSHPQQHQDLVRQLQKSGL